jgi:dihydroneopterin aldolase
MAPTERLAWLHLKDLDCRGRHGAYPGEKEQERQFLIDVSLLRDISAAAATDELEHTSDFAAIAGRIRTIVGDRPRTLLETLAEELAQDLLATFPGLVEVRLNVRKPEPPYLGASEESVEVTRSR